MCFLLYIGILFCLLWHMRLRKMSNYINQRLQIGEGKAWKMYIDDQFSFQWSLDEIHKGKLLATQLSSQNYHTDRAPLEIICFTASIYSQFTVIGCVTFATVIWQWLSQPTAVPTTLADIEEYSLRSIAILGCNIYSQITVAHVTLPKAVLSTVKIFAV